MFSAIKDKFSDFFLYMSESFSDMKERPWMILKYMIVWPILIAFGVLLSVFTLLGYVFNILTAIISIFPSSGPSSHTTYVYYDKDDF